MGIKKNFFLSSIITISGYIFPLITYPYVSRVLGVDKIGVVNFVDGIINYFSLFSLMGINILGIREVAKAKGDKDRLNKSFLNLFALSSITTFIGVIILIIVLFSVPKLYEHKHLFFIGVFKLVFNLFLIEWFYRGLEDFKYITYRTILVKAGYVVGVFLFVKTVNDFWVYYLLLVLMVVINSLFNVVHSTKYLKINFKQLDFKSYIKPFFVFGFQAILTSMYTSFNVAYLGFVSSSSEVGFYTTAIKLYSIFLAFFSAFTGVMMPRMSVLVSENRMDEFKRLTNKSFDFLFGFTIPVIIVATIFAPQIISIISGPGYEGAITPMRIVMPLLLVIGYAQVLILQVLIPLKKDKAIFINSILGAITGIVLNIILVKTYKSSGSAIVWVVSEIVVVLSGQYFVSKYLNYSFPYRKLLVFLFYSLPAVIISVLFYKILPVNAFVLVFLTGSIVFVYYALILVYVIKSELALNLKNKITDRLKN